jgi:predicted oxidoreductase
MSATSSPTSNGIFSSRMVYGTWRMLDGAPSKQEINRRLNRCVELGITTIDTAEVYGGYTVEAALGEAIALSPGLNDKLRIVTKSGIYVPNPKNPERTVGFYDASAEQIKKSVETSLRLLRREKIDLFLVHRPDWLTNIDDTAQGLNALMQQGKIQCAGVSNYTPTQFQALNSRMDTPLITNQVEFHLFNMDALVDGTFDLCQQLRIQPMAWSPLAGGKLFDASNPAAIRLAKAASALASKYGGATLEQLAYAWVMGHPSRPLPVIGTNKLERIESAVLASTLTLEREDWYALWVAANGHSIP